MSTLTPSGISLELFRNSKAREKLSKEINNEICKIYQTSIYYENTNKSGSSILDKTKKVTKNVSMPEDYYYYCYYYCISWISEEN